MTIHTHDALIALCFLDPLGVDLATLKKKMSATTLMGENTEFHSGMPNEAQVIAAARALYDTQASAQTTFDALNAWIGEPPQENAVFADKRITRAIEIIKSSVHENISVDDIAREPRLA